MHGYNARVIRLLGVPDGIPPSRQQIARRGCSYSAEFLLERFRSEVHTMVAAWMRHGPGEEIIHTALKYRPKSARCCGWRKCGNVLVVNGNVDWPAGTYMRSVPITKPYEWGGRHTHTHVARDMFSRTDR